MAFWDFVKDIRRSGEDEKKRDQQGGTKNRIFGFLDDALDTGAAVGNATGRRVQDVGGWIGENSGDAKEDRMNESIKKTLKALPVQVRADALEKLPDVKTKLEEQGLDFSSDEDIDKLNLKKERPLRDFGVEVLRGAARLPETVARTGYEFGTNAQEKLGIGEPGRDREFREKTTASMLALTPENRQKAVDGNEMLRKMIEERGIDINDDDSLRKLEKADFDSAAPEDPVRRFLYGSEPVKTYQSRTEGNKEVIEGSRFRGGASVLGPLSGILTVAGDVPGVGKTAGKATTIVGEAGIKKLAAEAGEEGIEKLIKGKFGEKIVKRIAPALAAAKNEDEVKTVLSSLDKPAEGALKKANELTEAVDPSVTRAAQTPQLAPTNPADEFSNSVIPKTVPTETPAVKGKAEQELLNRMKSTSEIESELPQKTLAQRTYEQWRNKDAPIDEYARRYKELTGEELAASENPSAIKQLMGGRDGAAEERVRPVSDIIEQSGDLDAVRSLGLARHLQGRSDSIPQETLDLARRAEQDVLTRLDPAKRAQVENAVQGVNKFYDDQLRELVDIGRLSEDGYKLIAEANPNYFGKINIVEHILENPSAAIYKSGNSSNQARESLIRGIKGISDDAKFEVVDPIENIVRSAKATQKAIEDTKLFKAIAKFEELDPSLAQKVRASEDVIKRMGLSLENQQLRPVRNKIDKMVSTRANAVRKLETQINNLEKAGLQATLKEGGERLDTAVKVIPERLGGKVPTSKAEAKLGPRDTGRFVRDLIEGPPDQLASIRKKIGTRDANMTKLLDDIDGLRSEYDDLAQRIAANSEDAKLLMDKDVPKGMKVISNIQNGVVERVAVPEEIYNTFMGLNDAQRDLAGGFINRIGKITKGAVTTYNPAFVFITNILRDIPQTAFTSKNVGVANYATVLPYAKKWLGSWFGEITGDNISKALTKAGAGNSGQVVRSLDPEKYAKNLARRTNGVSVKTPKDFLKEVAYQLEKVPQALKTQGSNIENATRRVEARAALKKNKSIEEAALGARTVTTDFRQMGHAGQVANQYLEFFNARLQGMANVATAIKDNPKRAAAVVGTMIAMPVTTGYIWNTTQFPDIYEQIDQDTKDNNFILITSRSKDEKGRPNGYITIPKGEAQKFFSIPIENGLRALANDDPDSISTIATKIFGSTLPIDVVKDGEFNGSRAVSGLLPTAAEIPAALAANKNFYFDSPIISRGMEDLPAEDQVRDSTSPIDKFTAAIIPGGQSPLQTEVVRRGLTGNLISNPVDQVKGTVTKGNANAPANAFYKIKGGVEKERGGVNKQINQAIERGDIDRAQELADEYNRYLQEAYAPFNEKYSNYVTRGMLKEYGTLKINLTSRSISQRRTSILDKQRDKKVK